tara:strand:+ start:793 stop:1290 length:498 start_codon:yes stop_codon:yes gene_type:complete
MMENDGVKFVAVEHLNEDAFSEFGDVIGNTHKKYYFEFEGEILHMNYTYRDHRSFTFDNMEKHFGKQGFIAVDWNPWVLVVAKSTSDGLPDIGNFRAFVVEPGKMVVLKDEVWHVHDRFPLAHHSTNMIIFCSKQLEQPGKTTRINLKEQYGISGELTFSSINKK